MIRPPNPLRLALPLALLLILAANVGAAQEPTPDPEIFAHRGFALREPENSLGSLRAALDLGLHGSEVDLRATRDGVLVLMHDASLERTTTGQGLVADHTLAELRGLRLKNRQGLATAQRIPTLDEALELLRGQAGFRLVLDIKDVDPSQAARQVAAAGLDSRVVFFVSDPQLVDQVRAVQAVGRDYVIAVDLLGWWKTEGLPTFAAHALGVRALFASEWFFPRCGFAEARQAGAEVMVYLWGEDDLPTRMRRAATLGAQVVSSDRPDQLISLVERRRAASVSTGE